MTMDHGTSTRILIRCDGGYRIGYGHVIRCLALADELRLVHGCHVEFFMRESVEGFSRVQSQGYPVFTPHDANHQQDITWPKEVMCALSADAVVFDCRDEFPRTGIEHLRANGMFVVTIDDVSDRCLSADLAFFPPIPQVERMDLTSFSGQCCVGWEWVLLRRDIGDMQSLARTSRTIPRVVISMGGSDPYQFTLQVLRACRQISQRMELHVVLGPGFSAHENLNDLITKWAEPIKIHSGVKNLLELIQGADLLVGAFGNTAYEAAALGCFGVYLCGTSDHAESASQFMNAGFGISLGLGAQVSEDQLIAAIQQYLDPMEKRRVELRRSPENRIDGLGAKRIATKLMQTMKEQNGRQAAMARA